MYRHVDAVLETPQHVTNLHHHQNVLRLLYTLSELSGKPKYRDAADNGLRAWLQNIPERDRPITRPWMLWNRCFEIAREPSMRFALAVVNNEVTNHPGFYLRACSAAYAHTTNEVFLRAIETLIEPMEVSKVVPPLSFGIDCDGCAHSVPEPLASRLRAIARRADAGDGTRSESAMTYVARYENTGKVGFREMIQLAAETGLSFSPQGHIAPATLGHAISLQLAAWRSTARQTHLEKARALADFALTKFFDGAPELMPGGDTLALALVELHLHILYITAVRYPPNTLDR